MLRRTHYLEIPLAVVLGIGVGLCVILLVLLTKRRHRMVIRERSFPLLAMSCLGNLAGMTVVAVDGLMQGETQEESWTFFYLSLFCEYLFFAPYLLRLYHFKVCYSDFSLSPGRYRRQVQRLTLRWFSIALLAGLLPYFLLPLISGLWYFTAGASCGANCTMELMYISWNLVCFCEALPFLIALYALRHTYEWFRIYSELKMLCVVMVVGSLLNLYAVNPAIYLIQDCRGLVTLYISNFLPVYRSLGDEYEVWLTPEVIGTYRLTMRHKEALKAFREFLKDTELQTNTSAEAYLLLRLALSTLPNSPSSSQLTHIYSVYCSPIQHLLPASLQTSALDISALCSYLDTLLEYRYFPAYLKSTFFGKLEERVELFLKIKNRDQEMLEEVVISD